MARLNEINFPTNYITSVKEQSNISRILEGIVNP